MNSIASAVAGAILLLATGAATAQQVTISDHVADLVKQRAEANETFIGAVEIAELGEDEISEVIFHLDPGKSYFVRGACDDDCSDIDLQAYNAAGAGVGEDTWPNELPKIEIPAGASGAELHILVTMESCGAETCVSGVGLFQSAS